MWKNLWEWFGALLITASMAVSIFGAAEWIEKRGETIPVLGEAEKIRVVLDAGHGGADGGAVGSETGVQEAGLNLSVAKRVEKLLQEKGVSVVMTRENADALANEKHADLAMRKKILNGDDVDIAVSIHMNAFPDSSISGPMAYYMTGSVEGQKLAQQVIDCISDANGNERRLANPGDYFILRECACPAVLVECGFLSNCEDEILLQQEKHQQLLAEAIVSGVCTYLHIS